MKRSWLITLVAVLALLTIGSATASAATPPIKVTETSDAPLEAGATTCESNDSAKGCTLRAAVELAEEQSEEAGGETVTVEAPAGVYTETLGTIVAGEDARVAIDGAGVGQTVIDGAHDEGVLAVEEGTLSLDGVTVREGNALLGGGVYVDRDAALSVESSAIEGNQAEAAGGGIFADLDSDVTVANSKIEGNSAGYGEFPEGYGGGIYAEPFTSILVEKSTIADNRARNSGGGIYRESGELCDDAEHSAKPHVRRASGGDEPAEQLTVKQSTIEGNTAEDGLGGGIDTEYDAGCEDEDVATAGHASAHHASAGHAWAQRAPRSEAATRAAVKALRPAAQELPVADSELTIEQSTIAKNRAEGDDEQRYSGLGGGIFEGAYYPDPIVNSTIAENVATQDGGGIADESDVEVLISDTVFANTIEPPENDGEDARHATARARPDAVVLQNGGAGNLAAAPYNDEAVMYLRDTIVAEPKGSTDGNCEGAVGSMVEGFGYNLDYPTVEPFAEAALDTCGMSEGEHDLVGVEPQLKGLEDNGGPTQTMALPVTSPAIGFVPLKEDCEETSDGPGLLDQRGEHRPGIPGEGCDVGAYEYQAPPPVKKEEVTEKEPVKEVVTEPTPPVETPNGTTTTTTTTTPAAGVSPFKIEAPAQCTSKRDIKIHIQNVKQFGIVSAVVSIDGKDKRTLTGKRLSTAIDLVGLPQGTFTVEIVAHTRSGHTLHGKRVYHTCHTKLPGRSYIPL